MNRLYHALNGFIEHVTPRRLVWILVAVFICYFGFVASARHDNFYSRRLDLGNMDQTVWNLFHGHGFTLTDPMGTSQESRLAVHADFLLVLLVPFYALWSNPKTLILIQTVIVCLGAIPVYWIAQDALKSKKLSLLFSAAYLLYPPLERMMLHDFHAVALSTTFLLFSYWYMTKKNYGFFVLFAVLAGLGKEQIWLITGLMGLYIAAVHKKPVFGVLSAALSFFFFYYLFWRAIPSVTPTKQHFAFVYLSDFGDRQNAILKHILTNPWAIIRTALLPDRLYYYFELLIPLGLFSLFAPWLLIFAAPGILINILSNNTLMRQIDYQYTADITPFVFIASIEGFAWCWRTIPRKAKRIQQNKWRLILMGFLCAAVLTAAVVWGELPVGFQSRFLYFTSRPPEYEIMRRVESQIGPGYSVSVTNNIGSHFSEREHLYNFPLNATSADYAIALLGDQYAWPSGDAQKHMVDELQHNPNYVLIAHENNFYAFKKNSQ